jgi:hypothetical protein
LVRTGLFRWETPAYCALFALAVATLWVLALTHPTLVRVNRYPLALLLFLLTSISLWLMAIRFIPPLAATLAPHIKHASAPGPRYGYLALRLFLLATYYLGFLLPIFPLSLAYLFASAQNHWCLDLAKRPVLAATKNPGPIARFLHGTAQLFQSLHVDTTVGLMNLILGPYSRTDPKGEPMRPEDHEPHHELVPDPTDHNLVPRPRTPGMTRSYLERVRLNYVDKQRQSRYQTIKEMTDSRTEALKSLRHMRDSEEDLYSVAEEAQLKRTRREIEQQKLTDDLDLQGLRTEVERQKLLSQVTAEVTRRQLLTNAALDDPSSHPATEPSRPPIEEDVPSEDLQKISLKGVLARNKSERSFKDWQQWVLREYPPYTAQRILDEAESLYEELNR